MNINTYLSDNYVRKEKIIRHLSILVHHKQDGLAGRRNSILLNMVR